MTISSGTKIFSLLKNNAAGIAIIVIFLIPFIVSAQAPAQTGWTTGTPPAGLTNVELDVILENIIIGILGFIGILGILYLVYGGIRYVTSAGDDSSMQEAKNIIMYAIWGLFITAASYAIVKTVVSLVR